MNWTRIAIAGLVGGIVANIADFIMHGMIMSDTYVRLSDVFSQEQANPLWFLVISVVTAFFMAKLFAKTRGSWAAGWKGGAAFGCAIGLIAFWASFYNPLVIDGFPYYLAWCWGAMNLITLTLMGAAIGAVYKS